MSIEEFKQKLQSITQIDGIGLNVFFLLKNSDGENILRRADIVEDLKDTLILSYRDSLNEIVSNEDLSIINLSAADDRMNAVYLYDLDDKPSVFNFFDIISNHDTRDAINLFSFENDNLSDMEGYFVLIGDDENNLIFYRKQMSVNLFKRGKIYMFLNQETQFERINQEILRIDSKIDVLKIEQSIYINNISILERHYEFRNIIESEANASLSHIDKLGILENIEVLQELVSDITFARKLSRIPGNSPVFTLPVKKIMQFVINHKVLGKEFRYNKNKNKILLDTKKSKNYFLKLMNDDFLHSELTNYDYATPAKDLLELAN